MPRRDRRVRRPAVLAGLAAVVALVAAGCGNGGGEPAGPTSPAPTSPAPTSPTTTGTATTSSTSAGGGTAATAVTTTTSPPRPPRVQVTRVPGFSAPLAMAVRAGDGALYIAEKAGLVRALRGGAIDPTPVLDLTDQVSRGNEQGLLGLAFAPTGTTLYVHYTDTAGDSRVVEYAFAGGRADPASRRQLLSVDQPFANHNGGHLAFGPDGLLYIGLGDGGSAGDPQGNGQRLDTLLGKILRIDPRPDGSRPYTIPPDNPFATRPGARPEIWAYGLRNPWRFSFDRETGALWIGDVGQDAVEEVNAVEASAGGGQNYGWNRLEGTRRFSGGATTAMVGPVHEYAHSGGNCSVTGGYVYRGARLPGLSGSYLFADYCRGELRALLPDGSGQRRSVALGPRLDAVGSFGQDAAGEVYVMSVSGGLHRLDPAP